VKRLNDNIAAVLTDPIVIEKLRQIGNIPRPSSPEEYKSRLAADIALWSKVIAEANIERI
jgi:tripartite-type tricarboxylate transporter receptor subunit TctC